MESIFLDREDAGRQLAEELTAYANRQDVIVVALPRGGVPVAYPVAMALNAPLDIFLVRKLGVPGQEELAMGAIASGDIIILNERLVQELQIDQAEIDEVITREKQIIEIREKTYIGDRKPADMKNKIVLLIDDGIATGATILAAIAAIKKRGCAKIIIAVPVAPPDTVEMLRREVDDIVCLYTPVFFSAIGYFYMDFEQTTDQEVITLLNQASKHQV